MNQQTQSTRAPMRAEHATPDRIAHEHRMTAALDRQRKVLRRQELVDSAKLWTAAIVIVGMLIALGVGAFLLVQLLANKGMWT